MTLHVFVSMNLVLHTVGRTEAEVFENWVLRNIYICVCVYIYIYIYRPERKVVKGDWRRLHSEELREVHSS